MTVDRQTPPTSRNATWMPIVILAVIAGCFALVLGVAQAETSRTVQGFVEAVVPANEFEVESSQLALQKSQNADVRQFAQHMIDDHTKAGDNLAAAVGASDSGMAMPEAALDTKHRKIMDKLNAANGADFDAQYVRAQVKAHDEAVALFDSYSRHGKDASVKKFASDTLPTLEEHKRSIYQLRSSI